MTREQSVGSVDQEWDDGNHLIRSAERPHEVS